MGSEMKTSGLYIAKRGSNNITSSFAAVRTNLIPSYSLTYAEIGMESIIPKLVSLSRVDYPHPPILWTAYRGSSRCSTTINVYDLSVP